MFFILIFVGFFFGGGGGGGGGADSVHTNFFCENNRKSDKITHCVDFFE